MMLKVEKIKCKKYRDYLFQRVIKDKDGNDIIEEVIVDEFGNKNIKK